VRYQRRNVFAALPQRRQNDWKNINAMEKILAELAIVNLGLEVAMCSHNNPDIDRGRFARTDSFDLAFFQYAEEFGLHSQRHVSDLVEEQGPMVRLLEFSDVTSGRAGERAFFVSKHF